MAETYTAPPRSPALNSSSSQADGLVHWWPYRLDYKPELDYVTEQEAVLSQNALLAQETTFGWGLINRQSSTNPNDADHYIVDPFTPGWSQNGPATFSLWHRPTSFVQYGQHTFYPGPTVSDGNNRLWIGVQPIPTAGGRGQNVYFILVGDQGSGTPLYQIENNGYKATLNAWNHYVATMDLASSDVHLYLNGEEVPFEATYSVDNIATQGFTAPFTRIGIGGSYDTSSPGAAIQGNALDFRIYNKALTAAEVAAMYAPATRWEMWDDPKFAEETLEVFFSGADVDFAEPLLHSGTSYECIFDETSGEDAREGPACVMRSRDVDGVMTYGDIVQVHGGNYSIEGMQPDGTGVTVLVLEAT